MVSTSKQKHSHLWILILEDTSSHVPPQANLPHYSKAEYLVTVLRQMLYIVSE